MMSLLQQYLRLLPNAAAILDNQWDVRQKYIISYMFYLNILGISAHVKSFKDTLFYHAKLRL